METPELKKIQANHTKSQAIGQFLDWLQSEKNICFCITPETHKALLYDDLNAGKMTDDEYDDVIEGLDEQLKFAEEDFTYIPCPLNIEKTLAEYFEIDLDKAGVERQGLLGELRAGA